MSSEEQGVSLRIWGRVQGVGFRWWTRKSAESLGVRGWVRNLPDGSVEVHAVGPQAGVSELKQAVEQGPPSARVERVEAREMEGDGRDLPERGFEIRR